MTRLRRLLLLRNGVEVPHSALHRYAVETLGFGWKAATIEGSLAKSSKELRTK